MKKIIWSEQDTFSGLWFEHTRMARTAKEAEEVRKEKVKAGFKNVRIESDKPATKFWLETL